MPRGVYERKPKGDASKRRPPKHVNGYGALLATMRQEREKLIEKVTALGTAIEALEAVEAS